MSHLVSDLFGLDPIDDGIQHWWSQNANIGKQDMDIRWNLVSKLICEGWEDPRTIKEYDDTDMGPTSIQSFVASILGREAEDSMENQHIRNKY